jgi:hypothetical protein
MSEAPKDASDAAVFLVGLMLASLGITIVYGWGWALIVFGGILSLTALFVAFMKFIPPDVER